MEGLSVGDGDPEGAGVMVRDVEGLSVGDGDPGGVGVMVRDGLSLEVWLIERVSEELIVLDGLALMLRVPVTETVLESERDRRRVGDPEGGIPIVPKKL